MGEKDSPHYRDYAFTNEKISKVINREVLSFYEIPVGWNNQAIEVVTKQEGKLLFRVSASSWKKEKIVNEIAALEFVKHRLPNIPIPKILNYGFAGAENDFHWILMEYVEGLKVQDHWNEFDINEKKQIIKLVADVFHAFHSVSFEQIGGFSLDPTLNSPVLCEYFDAGGLYANEKEWLRAQFQSRLEKLKANNLCTDPSILEKFHLFGQEFDRIFSKLDDIPVVFFHGDVAFRNVLITKSPNEPIKLAALLDWEWAGTRPAYVEFQWTLLEEDESTSEEERQWVKEQLKESGIDPATLIPQFETRMTLYYLIEMHMEDWRWTKEESKERAITGCKKCFEQLLTSSEK